MSNKNKNRSGVVYSTNPDFQYTESNSEQENIPAAQQRLCVKLDSKMRAGKIVTLIQGFMGTTDALESLCKLLKTKCGTGGSAKDGEIIIQGNQKDRVIQLLRSEGFQVK